MKQFFFLTGEYAAYHLWLGEGIDEVLVEALFIYTVLQVCFAIGLRGIFSKLNAKKWWAFLPGVNAAYLGDLCGCRAAGIVIALCKLVFLVASEATVRVFTIPLIDEKSISYHCGITLLLFAGAFLVRTIAGFFLYRKLIRRFRAERWWMIFCLLCPNLTVLFFGFHPGIW
jgi:hypothetical protein